MKKHFILLSIFLFNSVHAQQPPKWQAINECSQARQLSKKIAEIKNNGATKSEIYTIKSMSIDGSGIIGDLALVFFDMHTKGTSAEKFSTQMYQRCMQSNGY